MRSVIQTAVRRTVTVCMVVVIVFAAGILAAQSTPVSLLPDIAVPALGVLVTYPGASAASVEEQVTRPLDDALRSVGGATRLQTYSMDNAAALFFYFDYGVDLEEKSDEIRACIAKLELPAECAEPTLTTVDLNASAVATIAVWREDDDTEKLLADAQTLRGVLAGVEGVGDVVLTGAPADEIAVAPLQGLEMATLLLYETLSMGALDIPLGSYFEDGSPVSVRNVSDAATPEELGSLPSSCRSTARFGRRWRGWPRRSPSWRYRTAVRLPMSRSPCLYPPAGWPTRCRLPSRPRWSVWCAGWITRA